jgi:hypothetical protein
MGRVVNSRHTLHGVNGRGAAVEPLQHIGRSYRQKVTGRKVMLAVELNQVTYAA